jgi:hypothetical protein
MRLATLLVKLAPARSERGGRESSAVRWQWRGDLGMSGMEDDKRLEQNRMEDGAMGGAVPNSSVGR